MLKTAKYRAYLTPEQEQLYLSWRDPLIYFWNLMEEQQRDWKQNPTWFVMATVKPKKLKENDDGTRLKKGKLPYEGGKQKYAWLLSAFDKNQQVSELRSVFPQLKIIPAEVIQSVTKSHYEAWERYAKKVSKKPRWKSKKKGDSVAIGAKAGEIKNNGGKYAYISFPKLGKIEFRYHRQIKGNLKQVKLVKKGGWYYICISYDDLQKEPAKPINNKVIGIDRGIVAPIADSDGRIVSNPKIGEGIQRRKKRLQSQLARMRVQQKKDARKEPSNRYKMAQKKLQNLYAKETRQMDDFQHNQTRYYIDRDGTVVLEGLKLKNMTKSAKGTKENPGKNVKQKSGLNRNFLAVRPYEFKRQLEYKLKWNGGSLQEVNPAYTSQKCPKCGHISKENRKTQAVFCCIQCGYKNHADVVGAINIRAKFLLDGK